MSSWRRTASSTSAATIQAPEGAKEVIATLHRWMSDFSLTIEDVIADGRHGLDRNRARGVNTGSVHGACADRVARRVDVIDIGRFENGQLVEHWGIADQLGLMLQLGFVPGRGPAPVAGGRVLAGVALGGIVGVGVGALRARDLRLRHDGIAAQTAEVIERTPAAIGVLLEEGRSCPRSGRG